MSECQNDGKYTGKLMFLEFAETDDTSVDPRTLTFFKIGATSSNNYTLTNNYTDITDQDSGAVDASMLVGHSFECTQEGQERDTDDVKSKQAYLTKFMIDKANTGDCCAVWLRGTDKTKIIYAYCRIDSRAQTNSGPREAVTYSMSFTSTSTNENDNPSVQIDYVVEPV